MNGIQINGSQNHERAVQYFNGIDPGMYTELHRLRHVIALQGVDRAREWARSIASLYLGLIKNPQHYASQPEWKSVFERSARELHQFADAGVFPPELARIIHEASLRNLPGARSS